MSANDDKTKRRRLGDEARHILDERAAESLRHQERILQRQNGVEEKRKREVEAATLAQERYKECIESIKRQVDLAVSRNERRTVAMHLQDGLDLNFKSAKTSFWRSFKRSTINPNALFGVGLMVYQYCRDEGLNPWVEKYVVRVSGGVGVGNSWDEDRFQINIEW